MNYPKQIKARRKIEALTGIKSSLDKIRSVISFVYLLYVANGRKSFVDYSVSKDGKISINSKLLESIEKLIGQKGLEDIINNNPLITNQYEPLYVGVTLLMKLGYLKMEGKQNTAERTGGVRFPKQLYFANNTLVLDLILRGIPEDVRYLSLYEWLQNKEATNSDFEDRVCMFLSTCTVFTQFKLRDDVSNELFFQTEGIYSALSEGNNDVIYNDSHELVGPTRIYNNVLREGLEPWIEINKSVLKFSGKSNPDAKSMGAIISTTLDIHNVKNDALVSEENIDYKEKTAIKDYPRQQIFYGAPGTGKSDEVDDMCSKYLHHRITFHPDTDYSAFVGCYKPKTHKKNMLAGNGINETQLLSSFFDSNSSKYSGKTKARYLYESLVHTKDIRDLGLDAQMIADKLKAQNFSGCAYDKESNCMFNIYDWLKEDGYVVENKISYEFTPQCFIKAYVDAWKCQKDVEPVFLVIEEINRGNCAQIFGDLFQLLDRDKNGFSRYEISPDTDLQEYIAEIGLNISGIVDKEGRDISALIASGELMKLPNNLYIWATMNTSDQSLFPIDSAFKRRWDWKYIKIKKGIDKNTGAELDWKIKVGEERYDWWEFLNHINNKIARMTSSADKQLGYFFCLADGKGEINVDTFVNKVAFYLWNDVFKDYAEDGSPLLKYKKKEDDKGESDLTFPDFFDENGEIDTNVVKQFVEKVMKDDEMDKPVE